MVLLNPTPPTTKPELIQPEARSAESISLCSDDLPRNLYSDEPPLETDRHRRQIDLLIRLLESWWADRDDFYISGNITVYYNPEQRRSHHQERTVPKRLVFARVLLV